MGNLHKIGGSHNKSDIIFVISMSKYIMKKKNRMMKIEVSKILLLLFLTDQFNGGDSKVHQRVTCSKGTVLHRFNNSNQETCCLEVTCYAGTEAGVCKEKNKPAECIPCADDHRQDRSCRSSDRRCICEKVEKSDHLVFLLAMVLWLHSVNPIAFVSKELKRLKRKLVDIARLKFGSENYKVTVVTG
ncbi:hypothetical protein HELRODRAFT_158304 [Helobdella robusta]|uniref:Uncharacterized protein n=1 Tax=Helobdella robusta TaxID=6412 RepID=T1EMM2_HELRO|nr:hypothetical protein HELRODRAFT_158304 [Helobdella robusta]ESO11941.1 hypothetical protein HELRODRAFT_158304 [Helobdella robusta]